MSRGRRLFDPRSGVQVRWAQSDSGTAGSASHACHALEHMSAHALDKESGPCGCKTSVLTGLIRVDGSSPPGGPRNQTAPP